MKRSHKRLLAELDECIDRLAARTANWWDQNFEGPTGADDARASAIQAVLQEAHGEIDAEYVDVLAKVCSVMLGTEIVVQDEEEDGPICPAGLFLAFSDGVSMTTGEYDCDGAYDEDAFDIDGQMLLERGGASFKFTDLDTVRTATAEEIRDFVSRLSIDGHEEVLWAVCDLVD